MRYTRYNICQNDLWHVRQIGAGTALPGILAAKCGGVVSLSDSANYPRCLDNCRKSCEANGLRGVSIHGLTWGEFSPALLQLPSQDIILGSDCFYSTKGNPPMMRGV